MRAVVTGANGFVGSHVAAKLDALDWSVVRLGRSGARIDVIADLATMGPATIAERVRGVDVVFHCAGLAHRRADARACARDNVEATRRAFELARLVRARRFVFLSSARVLGDVSRHPFRVGDPRNPADAYAESKAEAEWWLETVAGVGPAVTVVRAPLVYGPGVRANFLALMRATLGGWPLPLGAATAPRSLVAIQNLVDLLVACLDDDRGHRLLHVRDAQDLSVAGLVRAIAAADGRGARLFYAPASFVRAGLRAVGRGALATRLFEPAQIDDRATRAAFGWTPTVATDAALTETVAWWRRRRS